MTPAEMDAISDALGLVLREELQNIRKEMRAEFQQFVSGRILELPQGPPGKDALIDFEALAERAAALIRVPRDGKDADPVDLNAIVLRVSELIPKPKDGADGRDGKDGQDGKDAEPVDEDRIIKSVLEKIPPPVNGVDGKDGRDGKDGVGIPGKDAPPVDVDSIVLRVAELVPRPENGKDGAAGRDGIDGKNGADGLNGKDGTDGKDAPPVDTDSIVLRVAELIPRPKDGKDGEPGADGSDGRDGKDAPPVDTAAIVESVLKQIPKPQDGRSVDPEEVRQLVAAAVTRAVSELPVAKDGEPGKPGKDGESIHPDTVALMVREAVDKRVADIPKPEPGKPGEPGRDALQMEILSTLDPSKSYPRGTAGLYNGGTIKANRTTTPGAELTMSEWDVLMDGCAGFVAKQSEDFRTVFLTVKRTSGKLDDCQFAFPVLLDRGGYKQGDPYFAGDVVTREGAMWICQAESTTAVPGTNGDWRLSVRKPRDGKDFRPQEPPAPNGPIRLK